jgi:predicted lipoprotein with Yx(FWY)xxD motif
MRMWATRARRTVSLVALAGICGGFALTASSATPPTVGASASLLGTDILVNSKGLALYHFLPETKGAIKCTGACSVLWPPLVIHAGMKPLAGPGLAAGKLGTIKRPDGRIQVTYNGLALYRDYYDKPGQLNGQGQQRLWFVVTPAGTVTKAHVTTPADQAAPVPTAAPSSTQQPNPDQVPQPPPLQCVIDDVCIPQNQ